MNYFFTALMLYGLYLVLAAPVVLYPGSIAAWMRINFPAIRSTATRRSVALFALPLLCLVWYVRTTWRGVREFRSIRAGVNYTFRHDDWYVTVDEFFQVTGYDADHKNYDVIGGRCKTATEALESLRLNPEMGQHYEHFELSKYRTMHDGTVRHLRTLLRWEA